MYDHYPQQSPASPSSSYSDPDYFEDGEILDQEHFDYSTHVQQQPHYPQPAANVPPAHFYAFPGLNDCAFPAHLVHHIISTQPSCGRAVKSRVQNSTLPPPVPGLLQDGFGLREVFTLQRYISREEVDSVAVQCPLSELPLEDCAILGQQIGDFTMLEWEGDEFMYLLTWTVLQRDPRCTHFRALHPIVCMLINENKMWFWLVKAERLDRFCLDNRSWDDNELYSKSTANLFEVAAACFVRRGGDYVSALVRYAHHVLVPIAVRIAHKIRTDRAAMRLMLSDTPVVTALAGTKRQDRSEEPDVEDEVHRALRRYEGPSPW